MEPPVDSQTGMSEAAAAVPAPEVPPIAVAAAEAPAPETAAPETAAPLAEDAGAGAAGTAERATLDAEEIQRVSYPPLLEEAATKPLGNIDYLKDVHLEAGVELGQTAMSVEQILKLGAGSIVELNQTVGEPVRLMINHHAYALGEVVVIGDKFGVRIGKLLHA
jgi:flagellar motor switch protein FliN/FliY